MAPSARTQLLTKTYRVLRKHYEAVLPPSDGSVLEHLLFACCLENAPPDTAQKAYATLDERFFDLNEVRVSTVRELAEAMHQLPDAEAAAGRLKRVLQSVFESHYAFDLESLRKLNLGQAIKRLEKYDGTDPFCTAYVTQVALVGHAISVNQGALDALVVIGAISEDEAAKHKVPGLERAIPKNKGAEFASLLHQFGVAFAANPYSPTLRKVLLEIAPNCKERLPKRPSKQVAKAKAADADPKRAPTKAGTSKTKSQKKPAPAAKSKKKPSAKTPPPKKTTKAKKATAKTSKKTPSAPRKSATKPLAKRKPK